MQRHMLAILCAGVITLGAARAETIRFNDQAIGTVQSGFSVGLTGGGKAPKCEVQKSPDAQGGNVVAETSATNYRFPLLVDDKTSATDLDLTVSTASRMWRSIVSPRLSKAPTRALQI
jgi:hypothetical protein